MILDRVEGFFFILDQAFSEKDLNHIFDLKAIVNVFSYGKKKDLNSVCKKSLRFPM